MDCHTSMGKPREELKIHRKSALNPDAGFLLRERGDLLKKEMGRGSLKSDLKSRATRGSQKSGTKKINGI